MLFKIVLLITHVAFSISTPLIDDEEKRLYNFGLGKRGYTYVSEYKRLPVYNFGLGKRSADSRNMYSFGLGKRDDSDESHTEESNAEKRSKASDFGLGKRLTSGYNFGLGKKAVPQYSFGLGKRLGYNFGLGKRQGKYSFGLGKKDRQYSFGLGKRYDYLSTEDDEGDTDSEYGDIDDEKRSKYEGQKFSFGLGKRELDDFLESKGDNDLERQIRGPHSYSFGLGKRSFELPLKSISSQPQTKETRLETKPTS